MKILLTGITGFIGHHLAERLVNDGHEVYAIVRPTSKIDELSDNLRRNVQFHVYDKNNTVLDIITNLCVADCRPDVVYHLASWLLSGGHKFEDIQGLIQSNITLGTELLDAMIANKIYNLVNADTFAQHYEDKEYSPANLYGATKQAFKDIIQYYVEAEDLKTISLCLFNIYGLEDNDKKLFATLKRMFETGETLKMSPGGQMIDILYIDDIIDAFVLAGQMLATGKYNYCGTYGVSSKKLITLREFVSIVEEIAGKKLSIEWGGRPYRAREIMVPWQSFKPFPGWTPKLSLQEGIKKFLGV